MAKPSSDTFSTSSTATASSAGARVPPPPPSLPSGSSCCSASTKTRTSQGTFANIQPRGRAWFGTLAAQKYIGWALIAFNVLYMIVLCLFYKPFLHLVLRFLPFAVAYGASLVTATFSLRLHSPSLLYPLLITTVPFMVVPLLITVLYISHHLCLAIPPMFHSNASLYSNVSAVDKNCPPDVILLHSAEGHPIRIAPSSVFTAFALVVIILEKLAEFLFFLHLMRRISLEATGARRGAEGLEACGGGGDGSGAAGSSGGGSQDRKRKKAKRKSIARQQNFFESPVEEGAEEGSEAEDMVYDNGLHRQHQRQQQQKAKKSPPTASHAPVPTVNASKRVIA